MENQFITYKQALELKELGFDEECFGFYSNTRLYFKDNITNNKILSITNSIRNENLFSAPLWQQAFNWFREKYNLFSIIFYHTDNKVDFENPHYFRIYESKFKGKNLFVSKEFKTYEEARLACLDKLIEIVKTKKS